MKAITKDMMVKRMLVASDGVGDGDGEVDIDLEVEVDLDGEDGIGKCGWSALDVIWLVWKNLGWWKLSSCWKGLWILLSLLI